MRLLLDTHVVIRWLAEPKRLSRNQSRALEEAVRLRRPVAISAITPIEIALLFTDGTLRIKTVTASELFEELSANPAFHMLSLTIEIAREMLSMGRALPDPADRVIAATARVHGLRLVTSDQCIVESNLVQTID